VRQSCTARIRPTSCIDGVYCNNPVDSADMHMYIDSSCTNVSTRTFLLDFHTGLAAEAHLRHSQQSCLPSSPGAIYHFAYVAYLPCTTYCWVHHYAYASPCMQAYASPCTATFGSSCTSSAECVSPLDTERVRSSCVAGCGCARILLRSDGRCFLVMRCRW